MDKEIPTYRIPTGICEVGRSQKYESSVPKKITTAILQKEKLPSKLPDLGSSIFEDFIIKKIEQEIISPEQIANSFMSENMPDKFDKYINDLKSCSRSLDWNKIFTDTDEKKIKEKLNNEMKNMDMTPKQISFVTNTTINIAEDIGMSSAGENTIYISQLQIIRKALDYIKVFGDSIPFEQILKSMMTSCIGHELGHIISRATESAHNKIMPDNDWKKNGESVENKDERFAEFWGTIAEVNYNKISKKEWLIHLTKVTEMWEKIENYNSSHDNKIDIVAIFSAINEKIKEKGKDINSFLSTRRILYNGGYLESYCSPYSREVVTEAIRSKNNE